MEIFLVGISFEFFWVERMNEVTNNRNEEELSQAILKIYYIFCISEKKRRLISFFKEAAAAKKNDTWEKLTQRKTGSFHMNLVPNKSYCRWETILYI